MGKVKTGCVLMKKPNGDLSLLVGFGKDFYGIDEDGCTKLEIVKFVDQEILELEIDTNASAST